MQTYLISRRLKKTGRWSSSSAISMPVRTPYNPKESVDMIRACIAQSLVHNHRKNMVQILDRHIFKMSDNSQIPGFIYKMSGNSQIPGFIYKIQTFWKCAGPTDRATKMSCIQRMSSNRFRALVWPFLGWNKSVPFPS